MPKKKDKRKKENSKFSFLNTILTHGKKKKKTHFFSSSSGNEIQKTFLLMKWKLFPPEFFSIFCVKLKYFFSLRAMGKKYLPKSCFLLSYTTKVLYFFCEKNINKTNWKHIFMTTFLGNFSYSNYTLDFFIF